MAELAIEHDLIVLADEIHNELVFPGHEHTVFETLGPEVRERTITITSATKSFNLAGLELALLVFGSEKLRRRFDELPHFVLAHPGILGVEGGAGGVEPRRVPGSKKPSPTSTATASTSRTFSTAACRASSTGRRRRPTSTGSTAAGSTCRWLRPGSS